MMEAINKKICTECGKELLISKFRVYIEKRNGKTYTRTTCIKCERKYQNERNLNLKLQVINHYGSRCSCCDESNIDLLVMDHVNGGGTKQVEELGGHHNFYRWLVRNNFPPGYQVLCWNCNDGREVSGGICPHYRICV